MTSSFCWNIYWCREGDLNPHKQEAHQPLKLARLPIPPSRQNPNIIKNDYSDYNKITQIFNE